MKFVFSACMEKRGIKLKYDIYLLDADETLFDFNKAEAEALAAAFEHFGFNYSEEIRQKYRIISQKLWRELEDGLITKDELQILRFQNLFSGLNISCDTTRFNGQYLLELGRGIQLLDGALELCQALYKNGKALYIVTNGILQVQRMRIDNSPIKAYLSGMFVSEEIGFSKPHKQYFEYVFSKIGLHDKAKALIIGDSLTSDIRGGHNAGIDTCWYNPAGTENPTGVTPTYEIQQLSQVLSL